MARGLAEIIGLKPLDPTPDDAELTQVATRLATSGYPLRPNPNFAAVAGQRAQHISCVNALAEHLGRPTAVLICQG